MTSLRAWHGSAAIREDAIRRMHMHRAEDSIVQQVYQLIDTTLASGYRGCAIGCLLPKGEALPPSPEVLTPAGGWHVQAEEHFGIPASVAHLIDRLFEMVPQSCAPDFAVSTVEAIAVGADLSLVPSHLMVDLLGDPKQGLIARPPHHLVDIGSRDLSRHAIEQVVSLHRRRISGDEPTDEQWSEAQTRAWRMEASFAANYAADNDYAGGCADAILEAAPPGNVDAYSLYSLWLAGRLVSHLRGAPVPARA